MKQSEVHSHTEMYYVTISMAEIQDGCGFNVEVE
jgi:hypothetical protein